jgi:hypothetical protein
MPELHLAINDGDESGAYGLIQARWDQVISNLSHRLTDFGERRAAVERRGEQYASSLVG